MHNNDDDYVVNQTEPDAGAGAYPATFVSTAYEAEHPRVRVHPLTGERSLVLEALFKRFVGLGQTESVQMFCTFQTHVTRLENIIRRAWRKGDVAIRDNQATQHYAVGDYAGQRRIVRRVTFHGEAPVAVDGQRSRQRLPQRVPELEVA